MGCNKYDISKIVEKADKNKTMSKSKKDIMNRVVFERMNNLSAYNSAKVNSSFKSSGAFTVVKFIPPMTKESSLAKYKLLYKDQLRLKLSPIKNYADMDRIRDAIYKNDDELYSAKRDYEKVADPLTFEDELLKVRLDIRNEVLNETNVQNEVSDLLEKIMDKTPEEQVKIIKKEFPEMSEEIIKDLLDIGE